MQQQQQQQQHSRARRKDRVRCADSDVVSYIVQKRLRELHALLCSPNMHCTQLHQFQKQ